MSFVGPGGRPVTQDEHESRWRRPPAAYTATVSRKPVRWAWWAAVVAALAAWRRK
jgi:MYXO-CTERM domain-containing protein